VCGINKGDIVVASDGGTALGVGRVTGGYVYDPNSDFPNRRPVEWLSMDEWRFPSSEDFRSTLRAVKQPENIAEIERRSHVVKPLPQLPSISMRVQSILERKSQVILYGPPGTGKTYWAHNAARELAARHAFGKSFDQLNPAEREIVVGDEHHAGLVRTCCFHPAYGYEDFLQGFRPDAVNGQMTFALRDGIFKQLCADAAAAPNRRFYLIIDEINRGDIPRIFGELLTVLEQDKRGMTITLPVNGARFAVPKNVFLIGTMNTADRSISLLDAALRRRFGFIELMPDASVLDPHTIAELSLSGWLHELNRRIRENIGRDARNLQIGHSYLLREGTPIREPSVFRQILRDDIIPLIEEYCYEDYSALAKILGPALVEGETQQIRHHLFEDGEESRLLAALHAEFNGRSAARQINAHDAIGPDESEESAPQ
jgi:5-methylcytosine-specific restriction protein B